jgi:abortive infection Abi-like protein
MYNLIMVYAAGTWDENPPQYALERLRFGEYTDEALQLRYRVLDERTTAELTTLPTLFAYEKMTNAPAQVGRVKNMVVGASRLRFEWQMLENVPPIPPDTILNLAFDLDIDDDRWEMNRTHWAVKNVDLIEVLRKAGLLKGPAPVSQPVLSITSMPVELALREAETLIETHGPSSGVDRIHTALHGYLIAISQRAGVTVPSKSSITGLLKALRDKHTAFQAPGEEIQRVLNSIAAIVDAINELRNRASLAHPTPNLLNEPEAALYIDSVRTILHYFDLRVTANSTKGQLS